MATRLDDVREVDDAVIAFGGIHLRGRGSGVAFDQPAAWIADFGTDHRIKRVRIYLDLDAAREAVEI